MCSFFLQFLFITSGRVFGAKELQTLDLVESMKIIFFYKYFNVCKF